MADPYRAGQALGEAIFGSTRDAYTDQLGKEYRAQQGLHDARRAQSLALIDADRVSARDDINDEALTALGFSPEAVPALKSILRANTTVDLDTLGKFQMPGYDVAARQAQTALLGDTPNIPAYNRANAFLQGKTYDPVVQEGGTLRPLGVGIDDDAFTMIPTPEAAERIDATQRKAGASVEKQGRAPAAKPAKAPAAASEENAVLSQARAAIAAGASVEAVRKRMKDRGYGKLAGRL